MFCSALDQIQHDVMALAFGPAIRHCFNIDGIAFAAQPLQNQKNELADVFKIFHIRMSDHQSHGFGADPAHELVPEIRLIAEFFRRFPHQPPRLLGTEIRGAVVQNLRNRRNRQIAAPCHIPEGDPSYFPFRRHSLQLHTKIVIQICSYQ